MMMMKNFSEFNKINEAIPSNVEIEQNRILSKIFDEGIESISKEEKEFLDSFSVGKEKETLDKHDELANTYDDGFFKFIVTKIEEDVDEECVNAYGRLTILNNGIDDIEFTGHIAIPSNGDLPEAHFDNDLYDNLEEFNLDGVDLYEFTEYVASTVR